MKVSVIIPTYNGAHKIIGVLRSLEQQTVLPDEVIVVVDGSTDGTVAVLRREALALPGFRIIEQENGGRSQVRNHGAAAALGELLIFFDDDMRLTEECLSAHIEHHSVHDGSILTGAFGEEIAERSTEIQRYKSYLQEKWNQPLLQFTETPMPQQQAFITAANFSLAKATFERLGGFDERLNDAEDYDLATRATRMAIPIYYGSAAFAWHDDFVTCASYIKRLHQYRIAQTKLMDVKREFYNEGSRYAVPELRGLKYMFFRFFIGHKWIESIDKNVWKNIPKPLRYRLYDYIITANGVYFPDKSI